MNSFTNAHSLQSLRALYPGGGLVCRAAFAGLERKPGSAAEPGASIQDPSGAMEDDQGSGSP
ncbi:hypothetical protein Hhel01_02710 [Haloferula helveola]